MLVNIHRKIHIIYIYLYKLSCSIFIVFFLQLSTDEALCPEQAPVCDGLHRLLHLLRNQCSSRSGRQDLDKIYQVPWIKSYHCLLGTNVHGLSPQIYIPMNVYTSICLISMKIVPITLPMKFRSYKPGNFWIPTNIHPMKRNNSTVYCKLMSIHNDYFRIFTTKPTVYSRFQCLFIFSLKYKRHRKNRLILQNETFDTKIMVVGLKNRVELYLSHAVSYQITIINLNL